MSTLQNTGVRTAAVTGPLTTSVARSTSRNRLAMQHGHQRLVSLRGLLCVVLSDRTHMRVSLLAPFLGPRHLSREPARSAGRAHCLLLSSCPPRRQLLPLRQGQCGCAAAAAASAAVGEAQQKAEAAADAAANAPSPQGPTGEAATAKAAATAASPVEVSEAHTLHVAVSSPAVPGSSHCAVDNRGVAHPLLLNKAARRHMHAMRWHELWPPPAGGCDRTPHQAILLLIRCSFAVHLSVEEAAAAKLRRALAGISASCLSQFSPKVLQMHVQAAGELRRALTGTSAPCRDMHSIATHGLKMNENGFN